MTLKELAKIAGVSISTVSKALNNSVEIGVKTKTKINELAKLYNYQPNNLAVNLKTGKTNAIGVIVPSIQNNFFAKVIMGIEDVLNAANYKIIISIANESQAKEAAIVNTLSNGVVDGFLIAIGAETHLNQNFSHFEYATSRQKKIVFFDRVINSEAYNKVSVDSNVAIASVIANLQQKGKQRIALVSSIHQLSVGQARKQSYLDAVSPQQTPIILECADMDLDNAITPFINTNNVDAIIALDEDASLFSLKAVKELQLNMPNDVAVIGFAPSKFARHLNPKLSTINQHGKAVGQQAAQLLLEQLTHNTTSPKSVVMNPTIDHRETT